MPFGHAWLSKRLLCAGGVTATYLIAWFTDTYSPWPLANLAATITATIAYSYLAICSFMIRPRIVGNLLGSLFSAPIALIVLTSPLVGFLLYAFATSGPIPVFVEKPMPQNITCQQIEVGLPYSSVIAVKLTKPLFSIFRHNVATSAYPDVHPNRRNDWCESLYAKYCETQPR